MDEQPIAATKGMAVGLLNRRADRRAHVREERGDSTCAASSRRLASAQAGDTLRYSAGPSPVPYQPRPKPSPLVGSAPIRACRLWSTIPCCVLTSSSSISTG
jgi:hypothetical protein